MKNKRFGNARKITNEEIGLALAWAQGNVNATGVAVALGHKRVTTQVYSFLALALREHIRTR